MRVGLVAVAISLVDRRACSACWPVFMRAWPSPRWSDILFKGLVGLFLGLLPAWIADATYSMVVLFAALGWRLLSAYADLHWEDKSLACLADHRCSALLSGALPALLTSPYTALVCGVLGSADRRHALPPTWAARLLSDTIMRGMDIILSFPSYLLAIAIVAFLGPGLEKGMIAIGIVGIPVYARLVRSAVLSVIQKEYILAAQCGW